MDWVTRFNESLEQSKHRISRSDFRFYNIAHLPLIARKSYIESKHCTQCNDNLAVLENLAQNLDTWLGADRKQRKNFEQKINNVTAHLQSVHNMRLAFYNVSFYTFLGIAGGFLAGLVLTRFTTSGHETVWVVALCVGLLVGRWTGYFIEKKAVNRNKQI
jgi:hypothetical protein